MLKNIRNCSETLRSDETTQRLHHKAHETRASTDCTESLPKKPVSSGRLQRGAGQNSKLEH